MKKILAWLSVAVLILSGCAKQEPPAPTPVYGTTPTRLETAVTIGGQTLSALYEQNGSLYLEEREFLLAVGGDSTARLGIESHTMTVTVEDQTNTYTTAIQTMGGESSEEIQEPAIFDGNRWFLPCESLLEQLGYQLFEDTEQNHRYYTAFPKAETLFAGVEVPVLMYHAVSDDLWGISGLFVSPSEMEKQLQYLTENGYTPIWFEDLENIENIEKPVILTFDDGYEDNYTNLYPLLHKYKVKATIFMITGFIGSEHYLNEEQIKTLNQSGLISFQSHSLTHPDLGKCSEEELEKEMLQSKLDLVRLTGKEPFVLCYPMGKWSDLSLEKTAEYYEYGLFMSGKTFVTGKTDRVKIYRKYVSRTTSLDSFANMIK
ncbi:MAG: polysaccharide deacetylase family protein [Clostridia bacterium]|nr:polysaccharide deacetylase family protein [Clostridia bacterium]